MLLTTRLTDYAVVLLAEYARPGARRLSATQAAARSGLPQPTVSKILKALGRAGILTSERGVAGGYRLDRNPESVPLLAVIEAMEGPFGATECSVEGSRCARSGSCSTEQRWLSVNDALRQTLQSITVADMLSPSLVSPRSLARRRPGMPAAVRPRPGPSRRVSEAE